MIAFRFVIDQKADRDQAPATMLRYTIASCVLAFPHHSAHAGAFEDKSDRLGVSGGNDACWFDLNNDGWVDLCAGGKVYENLKGERFKEIASVGACVAADFDNDGFLDLYSWNGRKLWRNERGTKFVELPLPDLPEGGSLGACWGDFNNDGSVDIYAGGYESWPEATYADFILTNRGGTEFELTWSEVRYRARGVTACDFDRDGDLDIYVSNYRLQPNVLWQNDGHGKIQDISKAFGALANGSGFGGGHSIGAAWGDFNNDGDFDLFAGNFAHKDSRGNQPESLWLRSQGKDGEYKFENKGQGGVFYQESYASPSAADYDNDGDLDLFFTTVYGTASFGRKNNSVLFRNDGGFTFSNATAEAKLGDLPPTYQAAWADFDNDGDLDLMAAGRLFVNGGTKGAHWLKVRLQGDGKKVNRAAIGTQVRVALPEGRVLTRQVEAGTGQGNQNELTLHFGLGTHDQPVPIEIFWPDGHVENLISEGVDTTMKAVGKP
jgi:hypothetical protein